MSLTTSKPSITIKGQFLFVKLFWGGCFGKMKIHLNRLIITALLLSLTLNVIIINSSEFNTTACLVIAFVWVSL